MAIDFKFWEKRANYSLLLLWLLVHSTSDGLCVRFYPYNFELETQFKWGYTGKPKIFAY